MKNTKKLLAILFAAVLIISLAACGSSDSEDTTSSDDTEETEETEDAEETEEDETEEAEAVDLDFYMVGLMSGGAAWSRAENGFLDACEELGINGQYLSPVERNSTTEMAELLDKAVVAQADAVIGCWTSEEVFSTGLLNVKEYGGVTISIQVTLDEEYVDANVGTDQEDIGREMGETLAELAGDDEITVVFMCGSAGELTNMQYDAFCAVCDEYDNITVLEMQFDDGSASTANQVISDLARANSDINAVVCLDSSAATIGVASYIQENSLEDEWITIGIDASADILNYVLDGALDCTINQDFYAMGYDSVYMAYDLLVNGVEPEFNYYTDIYPIYADEVEEYAAENDLDLTGEES